MLPLEFPHRSLVSLPIFTLRARKLKYKKTHKQTTGHRLCRTLAAAAASRLIALERTGSAVSSSGRFTPIRLHVPSDFSLGPILIESTSNIPQKIRTDSFWFF
ncbi:hypothetical protein RB195_013857 [Necator americanus]|uniref:Uncharacterized protein n=1 Tax=Necator americanus TaxID=51031 RepID=A0ABR1DXG0_NECAM